MNDHAVRDRTLDQGKHPFDTLARLVDHLHHLQCLDHRHDNNARPQHIQQAFHGSAVCRLFAPPGGDHIDHNQQPDARTYGGQQENDRHQIGRPPFACFQRSEQEPDVAVQTTRTGYADHRQPARNGMVGVQRTRRYIIRPQGKRLVHFLHDAGSGFRHRDNVGAKRKPGFQQQQADIKAGDITEGRHRRGPVRRQHRIQRAGRLTQVKQQRSRREEHEAQRRQQRKLGDRRKTLHTEHVMQAGYHKRTGNQPGDIGIDYDKFAPRHLGLVRKRESGKRGYVIKDIFFHFRKPPYRSLCKTHSGNYPWPVAARSPCCCG